MREKAPAVQWYPKQYLGDDKVIAMDWDARGMHHWLLNISWQQDPPGSLPDDMDLIRRWLGSPDAETWRRVRPQIFNAWSLRESRWVNAGMVRAWERQQSFSQSRTKSSKARWEGTAKAIRNEYENDAKAQKTEEEVKILPLALKLEEFDCSEAFEELCRSYTKSERSYIAQNRYFEAVEWCVDKKKITRKEAANYIRERAEMYCSKSRFQKGLTKWLEEKIFEQDEAVWSDGGIVNGSNQPGGTTPISRQAARNESNREKLAKRILGVDVSRDAATGGSQREVRIDGQRNRVLETPGGRIPGGND